MCAEHNTRRLTERYIFMHASPKKVYTVSNVESENRGGPLMPRYVLRISAYMLRFANEDEWRDGMKFGNNNITSAYIVQGKKIPAIKYVIMRSNLKQNDTFFDHFFMRIIESLKLYLESSSLLHGNQPFLCTVYMVRFK